MKKGFKDVSKYSGDIICPNCKGIRINKFGRQNNKQRYVCGDCRKTFIVGEDSRKRYSDEFKLEVIKLYLEGMGIRSIERIKQVHNTVILQWIRKFAYIIKGIITKHTSNIGDNNIKNNIEIMEIDELVTYVKKNLKIGEEEKERKNMGKNVEKKMEEIIPGYGLLLIETKIILLTLR